MVLNCPGPYPVTVIVPMLNEEKYIAACLRSLLAQEDCNLVEIMVADGGSLDRSRALVQAIASEQRVPVCVIDNPGRIQAAGFNRAAALAHPEARVLVRADAHTVYPPDFIARCVEALVTQDATSVVVPMRTVGRTGFQKAVAAAQNSRIGNGNSPHRNATRASRFVRHGHHAAFDRAFFDACGGYDEAFSHNEDAELDHRARMAGGRIWMCAEACVDYFPRASPKALMRQYVRFGSGRARMFCKHRLWPEFRQLAPVLVFCTVVFGFLLCPFWIGFIMPALAYALACLTIGAVMALRQRDPRLLTVGAVAIIMHLSFGFGFVDQLFRRAMTRTLRAELNGKPRTA